MSERLHIVVEKEEKERFRRQAEREGMSLSEWLREAGREKLAAAEEIPGIETVSELRDFFAGCDERRGEGREPDWSEHRSVIEESIRGGGSTT